MDRMINSWPLWITTKNYINDKDVLFNYDKQVHSKMMKMYEGLGHLLASDSLKANLAWLKSNPSIYESQKKEKKL